MRKKKNLTPRMESCASLWIKAPAEYKGKWRTLKPDAAMLRLELGCGVQTVHCGERKLSGYADSAERRVLQRRPPGIPGPGAGALAGKVSGDPETPRADPFRVPKAVPGAKKCPPGRDLRGLYRAYGGLRLLSSKLGQNVPGN